MFICRIELESSLLCFPGTVRLAEVGEGVDLVEAQLGLVVAERRLCGVVSVQVRQRIFRPAEGGLGFPAVSHDGVGPSFQRSGHGCADGGLDAGDLGAARAAPVRSPQ
ncbi:hypothetical protein [Streptomyces sp. NPDC047042]|uniref:hypothetical protein n=1 Tax=Streptomyces sp. NPDC047042 TaxID=3154807 RepID=UPI0033D2899A